MKKKLFVMEFLVIALLQFSVFAHSGRTDNDGGHWDNINKSGLGSYHYHCNGYLPHLHSNGICPYNGEEEAFLYDSYLHLNISEGTHVANADTVNESSKDSDEIELNDDNVDKFALTDKTELHFNSDGAVRGISFAALGSGGVVFYYVKKKKGEKDEETFWLYKLYDIIKNKNGKET